MKTLTFRQYVGGGHAHYFKNETTGEVVCVSATAEEYLKMGEADGKIHNPVLQGHTWLWSANGSIRVDTPSQLLSDGEYTTVGGQHCVGNVVAPAGAGMIYKWVPLTAVNEKHEFDDTLWP